MRLFVVGPGRHGKDTVAQMIKGRLGLDFASSSEFVAKKACRPWLKEVYGIEYDTLEECYADRINHRAKWREAIENYCGDDLQRMSREIFQEHDVYVGIRRRKEFLASKHLANISVWVDASERIKEQDESLDILESDCDVTVTNNGGLEELKLKVRLLCWGWDLRPNWS